MRIANEVRSKSCSVPRFFRELSSNDFRVDWEVGNMILSGSFGVLARGRFSDSLCGDFGNIDPWDFIGFGGEP